MWIYSTPPCHSNIILQTCKWPPKANPNQRFWGLLVLCLKKIQRTVFPQNCFCLKASLVSGGRTKKGAEKLLNGQAVHWAENQDEWRRNKQGEPAAGNSMEWMEDKTHCSWEVCTCLKNNSGNLEEWLSLPSLPPVSSVSRQRLYPGLWKPPEFLVWHRWHWGVKLEENLLTNPL